MSQAAVLTYSCGGDRPWLGGWAANASCGVSLRLLVRTASNAYFAQVVSALRLPEPDPDPLTLRIRQKDVWSAVHKVTRVEQLAMLAEKVDFTGLAVAEDLEHDPSLAGNPVGAARGMDLPVQDLRRRLVGGIRREHLFLRCEYLACFP